MGIKFIPSIFNNSNEFIYFLLNSFDRQINYLNNNLFFYKNNNDDENNNNLESEKRINNKEKNIVSEIIKEIKKKFKNKEVKNNFFFSKETLEFRDEFIENLKLKDFEINCNLSKKQITCIKKFLKEKPFKITICDKNVGWAIIDYNLYNEIGNNYLKDNNNFFKEIEKDPQIETLNKYKILISDLFNNEHISERIYKILFTNNLNETKLGKLELMPKVHKNKFSVRPVISNVKHITAKISMLIDRLLQPYVKNSTSYIKDSQNLIQNCENLKIDKTYKLYSCDFESLYTNINSSHAIDLISEYYEKYIKINEITTLGFKQLLEMVFFNNIFEFNEKYYVQINGLSMGTICGPSIANLYLSIIEDSWLRIYKPYFYKRYIDDIFIADKNLNCENLKNNFSNLKLNINTNKKVQFLDLNIEVNEIKNKLDFSLYVKPTNTFQYLESTSNHPNFIFENIPKSLFIRLRRINSKYIDYIYYSNILINQLIKRGYKKRKLQKIKFQIGNIDREKLIPYKTKNRDDFNKKNRINIKINYDLNYKNMKNDLNLIFNKVKKDNKLNNNLKLNYINLLQPNLLMLVAKNFKLYKQNNKKTLKCEKADCKTCKYIYTTNKINDTTLKNIPIVSNGSCWSKNCVYILKCTRCNFYYIGQTKNFKKRMYTHIYNIKKFDPKISKFKRVLKPLKYDIYKGSKNKTYNNGFQLYKHFNESNHNLDRDFKYYIFKTGIKTKKKRLFIENDLINLFINSKEKLLNDFIPKHYYCKKFLFS